MTLRYGTAALLAALVTSTLFLIMQLLIAPDSRGVGKIQGGRIVEFVRLEREQEIELKHRELPNRKPPEEFSPPTVDLSNVPMASQQDLNAAFPVFVPAVSLTGRPHLGGASGNAVAVADTVADSEVVPLVRVNPQYPARAMQRGIEGWVLLEFTVTEAGTTKDAVVLDADPKNYFERAALNAVGKYKYKAKIENGKPVPRHGVQIVISFELED